MQATFVKEERMDGTVVYYTRVDGRYVTDSLSFSREKAEQYFAHIVQHGNALPIQTVLQSAEIAQHPDSLAIPSPDKLSNASSRLSEQTV